MTAPLDFRMEKQKVCKCNLQCKQINKSIWNKRFSSTDIRFLLFRRGWTLSPRSEVFKLNQSHLSHLPHVYLNLKLFNIILLQEFDMSVEELSETLVQIKTFRMQQESRMGLPFLSGDVKGGDSPQELAAMQASHAETVLELRKTTHLLLVEHQISKDLQVHITNASVRKKTHCFVD